MEAFLYGNCNVASKFHYYFNTSTFFSGDIPALEKVEAFLYRNSGGIFSVRAYLHAKNVEAFLYGNCNVALKYN